MKTQQAQLPTASQPATARWIAGRVQTLLSHYYQPDTDIQIIEAAVADWVNQLSGFTQAQIEAACRAEMAERKSGRPTPGNIRARINDICKNGNKNDLSHDELVLLETKIIPTARKWLMTPGLEEHGRDTLAYWGEI